MDDLKPCPFCAAKAKIAKITTCGYRAIATHEAWCPMTTRTRSKLDPYQSYADAVAAWNTRDGDS